jgi:ribosome-binding protein aMBF1 (putative translation factor)
MGWLTVSFLLFIFIAYMIGINNKCNVCGQYIKKKYYTCEIDGRTQKLCPNCNKLMEKKISKKAFDKKFG